MRAVLLADFASAVCLAAFGVWIGIPELSTPTAPATSWLTAILPRNHLMIVFVFVGVMQAAGVLSSRLRLRMHMAFITAVLWSFLAAGILTTRGTVSAFAFPLAALMVVSFWYNVAKARSEHT